MPKYKVTTDQGVFHVELDSAPSSQEQLQEIVRLHLTGKAMDETQAYQKQEFDRIANQADSEPAMIKRAVEPRPRTFTGHLAKELSEGVQGIKDAAMPEPTGSPVADAVMQHPAVKLGRAGLSGLQALFSPATATARAAADYTGGNLAEKLAPTIGANAAAAVGTAVGTPVEFFLSGGGSLLKQAAPALRASIPGGIGGKAGNVGQAAVKGAVKKLPGAQAAQMEAAIDTTRAALEGKISAATANAQNLQRAVGRIPDTDVAPLRNTLDTLSAIIADETAHGIRDSGVIKDAARMKQIIESSNGAPSVKWIDNELTRIGEKTKAVKGVEAHPAYKRLFAAMADDLENTAPVFLGRPSVANPSGVVTPSGAGRTVRARDKALREQFGWEDLTDEFEKLVKTKKGMEGAQDVNTAQLLNRLKRKDFLMESLKPDDWKDIEVIFQKIADMPALPPPKGVMAGSYRALTTGGGGAALATLLGADPTTATVVGGGLMALERASMQLLPSRVGRKLVRSVLEAGPVNKEAIDMLTAAANAVGNTENSVDRLFKKKAANQ